MCQDLMNFSREIKNIRHYLKLNENQQEYIDSILKPANSDRPFPDTIYRGAIGIPHVRSTSEKFRCTGNRFNVKIIFET